MSVKRETVAERKALPLASGVLDYFPDALLVVAEVSRVGNEQHHPGEPLHWDKSKSSDEADALLRHLLDRGTFDTDGLRHSGKVAWRALAMLQRELDAEVTTTVGPAKDHEHRALTPVTTIGSKSWAEAQAEAVLTLGAAVGELCACHVPGIPIGSEHIEFVRATGGVASHSEESGRIEFTPGAIFPEGARTLGYDPNGNIAVEPWGAGEGSVYGMDKDRWNDYGLLKCPKCGVGRGEHLLTCRFFGL